MTRKIRGLVVFLIAIIIFSYAFKDTNVVQEVSTDVYEFVYEIYDDIKERISDSTTTETIKDISTGIKDFEKTPSNWTMTNRTAVPATAKDAKGGISIEEEWTHTSGFKMYRHDVKTVHGISIKNHPHWRLYSKPGGD